LIGQQERLLLRRGQQKANLHPLLVGNDKENFRQKAEVSMAKSRKPRIKWYSPQALAERADDGFLFVVRSTGKAIRSLPSGTVNGISRVGEVSCRRRKKEVEKQTDRAYGGLLSIARSAGKTARFIRCGPTDGLSKIGHALCKGEEKKKAKQQTESLEAKSTPEAVTEEEPRREEEMEQEGLRYAPLDLEALLKQHFPRDRVEAIKLRKALDDLLHGPEPACLSALKTLVGLGQVAEPFLVASLQVASPQAAEIALEGLSRIDSQRLTGCISDVLASSAPELRIVALRAAQRLRDDEARPFLEQGLRDPSARVKRRVLSYLSWHDSSWALAETRPTLIWS